VRESIRIGVQREKARKRGIRERVRKEERERANER